MNENMQTRLKWYTVFCVSVLVMYLSWTFGFLDSLYTSDITKISWVIIGLYFLFSLRLGYRLHRFDRDKDRYSFSTNPEWFAGETMLSLGMIGTVVGFIYMLTTVFIDLNVEDTASVQEALGMMATGMGTALWTTLVGLIASVLLKLQLVLVDEHVDG